MANVRFVGLDVHAETIAVAVAESTGEVRSLGTIPNRPEAVRRLVRKLGPPDQLRVCYEAGPTGYVLYWQLIGLGVHCDVIAPSLVPVEGRRPGQDGSARCRETRAQLPRGRSDAGVGARCRARSAARSGAGAGGGEEGPTAGAPSARQIPVAPWPAAPRALEDELDRVAPRLDPDDPLRVAGASGRADGLSARSRTRRRSDRGPERRDRSRRSRRRPPQMRVGHSGAAGAPRRRGPSRRRPSWRKSASSPASRTRGN